MNKITNIKERILYYAEYKKIAREKFFTDMDMTYANFKGHAKKTPLNSNSIVILLTKYPEINPHWLLTGFGNMLIPEGLDPEEAFLMSKAVIQTDTFKEKLMNADVNKLLLQKDGEIATFDTENRKLRKEVEGLNLELIDANSKIKSISRQLVDLEKELEECRSDKDMYKRIIDKTL